MKELEEMKITRKKLSSWDVMASILKPNVKPTIEEIDQLNSFFFSRYLASNKHSVPIAAVINRFHKIPIRAQFRFAQDYSDLVGLPGLVKFINYRAPKKDPKMEEVYTNIEKRYKVSRTHAEEYFELMVKTPEGQECLTETMKMFQHGVVK